MTDMDELITWLRAQLDEDERAIISDREIGEQSTISWRQMLADIDAKRRILDLHAPVHGYDPNGPVCSTCGEQGNPGDEAAVVRWPCLTVRVLALPYAHKPGYQDIWRP